MLERVWEGDSGGSKAGAEWGTPKLQHWTDTLLRLLRADPDCGWFLLAAFCSARPAMATHEQRLTAQSPAAPTVNCTATLI